MKFVRLKWSIRYLSIIISLSKLDDVEIILTDVGRILYYINYLFTIVNKKVDIGKIVSFICITDV